MHRLPTVEPRDLERFSAISMRALTGRHLAPAHVQHAWLAEQGPRLGGFREWSGQHARAFDVAVVLPYLYLPAFEAITTLAGRTPLVFHPCAHDEPPLRLPALRAARPAQRRARLLHRRGGRARAAPVPHLNRPSAVTGIGIDTRDGCQRGPIATGRDTGCRRTAVPRMRRSHRPGQGNARAGRMVRPLQGCPSRPARARARGRSCERGAPTSRCLPHR